MRSMLGQRARVVGERRTRPRPESRDYIHIAAHVSAARETFNTIAGQTPRRVEIAGVRLIWDRLDDSGGLMAYQGEGVLDLEALTLYADQVVVRSPLRFPGTTVTIHARELVFEGNGSIDTSPRRHLAARASSPPPTQGEPPRWSAADGANGEPAGDIHLHVETLRGAKAGGPRRFIARGSDGQVGEDGGYLPYAPRLADQPAAEKGKDLNPVTIADLRTYIDDAFAVKTWFWPGNAHAPEDMTGARELADGKVVHLRLIARDDGFVTTHVRRTYFPGRDTRHSAGCHLVPPAAKVLCVNEVQKSMEEAHDPTRLRPGDGRDAFPSGRSGDAGDGGSLVLYTPGATVDASICELTAGQAGARSQDIAEDPPGAPFPALWYRVLIVKREVVGFQSPRHATLEQEDVSALPGKPAAGRAGVAGRDGVVTRRDGGRWLRPEGLAAVLQYARDAYANGWREDAAAALAPYDAALADLARLAPDLLPLRAAAVTMASNLATNLDFFGHPVGWVPRLNVSTNLRLFQRERLNSAKLLLFARRLRERWDALARQDAFAEAQTTALEEELELAQAALAEAFVGLGPATSRFDATHGDLQRLYAKLGDLERAARNEAKHAIQQLELFHGFCRLVAGLAKVVPVGQPYLGIGGDVLAAIGDMTWTDAAGNFDLNELGTSFEGLGKTVGGKVGGFVKAHKERVTSDDKLGLRRQLKDAAGSMRELDRRVAEHQATIDGKWESIRAGELRRLEDEVAALDRELAGLPSAAVVTVQEQRRESLKAEIERLAGERLERVRERLTQELAATQASIAEEDRERRSALAKQIAELTAEKGTLKERSEELKADSEDNKERLEQSWRALAGVGDGVALLGKGLRSLMVMVDDDDPRVAAMMQALADSDVFSEATKQGIREVRAEIDRITKDHAAAMTELLRLQHAITDHTGALASNLGELAALSRQRQSSSRALDVATRRYLEEIEARATRRLQGALHDFVQSYQYQYLRDVSDSFYNFEHWVRRLVALEASDGALTDAQFLAVEDEVLREHYWEMAREIVESRQRQSASKQNTYECSLSPAQRATLLARGSLTLHLVDDLGKGSYDMTDARVTEIVASQLNVTGAAPDLSLDLCFAHGARSLIRDSDGNVWFFQRSSDDPPVAWRFIYNASNGKVTKDADLDANDRDEALDKLLTGHQGDFRDHWPAFFASVTVTLRAGPVPARERITSLEALAFAVKFVRR